MIEDRIIKLRDELIERNKEINILNSIQFNLFAQKHHTE